ncbi:GNAT family N-acetyltransferase [Alkaliphilus serpentinus]|uniref:GNAT family N-acetyltransferase n=1 Tax=Alkaliphilus serpentinus TaxID=1482731 RepID=A0A833M9C3_9FIRM|nr:GNAT family N-acetyltransferase [Alkaliphilus serpentinus]KAB3529421.1 GNAT family N-acetyltransferase [Alkaliphilus serpentinus]
MKIEYREYNSRDEEELKQMIRGLYKEDQEREEIDDIKIHKTIREFMKNPSKLKIIIISYDNHVVGYSILIPFWSNEYGGNIIHIDELFIKGKYRNQGIGRDFIKNSKEFFEEVAALAMEVTSANRRALSLYRSLGFLEGNNKHLIYKLPLGLR